MSTVYMEIETGIEAKCRGFMPALNEATKEGVRLWHKNVFPRHFKSGAESRYGYQRRNEKYLKYKHKKKPGRPALVHSGYSRKILGMAIRVTGTKGNVKGRFTSNSAMRYFWMTAKGQPNKPAEMKIMTDGEAENMNRYIRARTVDRIERIQKKRRVK